MSGLRYLDTIPRPTPSHEERYIMRISRSFSVPCSHSPKVVFCAGVLSVAKMPVFDVFCHALMTLIASLPSVLSPQPISSSEDPTRESNTHVSSNEIDHALDSSKHLKSDIIQYQRSKPQRRKKSLTVHTAPPQQSMNTARTSNDVQVVQEIPSARDAGVLNPNTGFPEPLSPGEPFNTPHHISVISLLFCRGRRRRLIR